MRSKAYRASFFVISLLIISFGVKLIIDIMWSVLSLLLGLIVMHGFVGTREGTVIAALLVGPMIRAIQHRWPTLSRSLNEKASS